VSSPDLHVDMQFCWVFLVASVGLLWIACCCCCVQYAPSLYVANKLMILSSSAMVCVGSTYWHIVGEVGWLCQAHFSRTADSWGKGLIPVASATVTWCLLL